MDSLTKVQDPRLVAGSTSPRGRVEEGGDEGDGRCGGLIALHTEVWAGIFDMMKSRHESPLAALVEEFVVRLTSIVQEIASQRLRMTLLGAFDVEPRRGPGRPPKNPTFTGMSLAAGRSRRPKQLCPVPGCKNVAAPVFGMVCGTHRDVPKAKIQRVPRGPARRSSRSSVQEAFASIATSSCPGNCQEAGHCPDKWPQTSGKEPSHRSSRETSREGEGPGKSEGHVGQEGPFSGQSCTDERERTRHVPPGIFV